MNPLLQLNIRESWRAFVSEGFAFWMACFYLLFEYVRPQGIYPAIDILPWTQLFIVFAIAGFFLNKNEKYINYSVNFWLILFFFIILNSCQYAFDRNLAFGRLADYYTWVIIYFMLIHVVNNEKRLYILVFVFFLSCYKMSLFAANLWVSRGFSFADFGIAGPPGYFTNSGELSLLMAMFFCMSLTVYIALKKDLRGWKKLFLLSMPITAAMANLASSSRGSQIAMVTSILLFMFVYKKISFKNLIIICVSVVLIYNVIPDEQLARFETAGDDKSSQARLIYWDKGLEMMEKHPFVGVGHWNFPAYFDRYYSSYKIYEGSEVAHNIFVEVGSTLGYPGLLVFIIIILESFRITRKLRSSLAVSNPDHWLVHFSRGLDLAMISYLIGGQFMSVAFYPFVWIHLAFAVAACNVAKKITQPTTERSRK